MKILNIKTYATLNYKIQEMLATVKSRTFLYGHNTRSLIVKEKERLFENRVHRRYLDPRGMKQYYVGRNCIIGSL
jgi:hypothetical protein